MEGSEERGSDRKGDNDGIERPFIGRSEQDDRGFACPKCGRYRYASNPFPPGMVGMLTYVPCECPRTVPFPSLFGSARTDDSGQHTRDIPEDPLVGLLGDDYWESPESNEGDDEDDEE